MKGSTGAIVGVILAILIILGVLNYQKYNRPTLYIGITDATADIKNVTDVDMEIKKVEVHSATDGWVEVSSGTHMYSLLSLRVNNQTQFYAKSNIKAGLYDKVRVTLGDVNVRTNSKGNISAVLPSHYLTISSTVDMKKGKDSYILLDFLADKSLHTTIAGEYIFAPVVTLESQSKAKVTVDGDNNITSTGGSVDSSVSVGMNLEGKSKTDFELITGQTLMIHSLSEGEARFILGGELYTAIDKEEVEVPNISSPIIKNVDNAIKTDGSLNTEIEITDSGSSEVGGTIKIGN